MDIVYGFGFVFLFEVFFEVKNMFVKYLVDEGVDCFVLKDVVYIINCDFFLNC